MKFRTFPTPQMQTRGVATTQLHNQLFNLTNTQRIFPLDQCCLGNRQLVRLKKVGYFCLHTITNFK